ncbi:MAG: DUF4345 family protein [Pseudomonadota bacterium]
MFALSLAIIGLGFGAIIGLGSLFNPAWAADIVRLQADPVKPGGYSEFRATYGGLLFMVHFVALVLVLTTDLGWAVTLPIAAGWFGAAIGRSMSLILDKTELREPAKNPTWIATEIALGLAIGAPSIHHLLIN